jgi:hypothetical protein
MEIVIATTSRARARDAAHPGRPRKALERRPQVQCTSARDFLAFREFVRDSLPLKQNSRANVKCEHEGSPR